MIPKEIIEILRNLLFTNPFSNDFDENKLIDALNINSQYNTESLIIFLKLCNNVYIATSNNIETLLKGTNLSNRDLIELAFKKTNANSIFVKEDINSSNAKQLYYEPEKNHFLKIDRLGQEVDATFSTEISTDILMEFVNILRNREENLNPTTVTNIKTEELSDFFNEIFLNINIVLNIKNDAYYSLLYEGSDVKIDDNKDIRIVNGSKSLYLSRTIGEIRRTSQFNETFYPFFSKYGRSYILKKTLEYTNENGLISIKILNKEDSDSTHYFIALSSLLNTYPYFTTDELPYFNNISLNTLSKIHSYLLSLFNKIADDLTNNDSLIVPIKIRKENLITVLAEFTEYEPQTIKLYIESLITPINNIDLWKSPFLEYESYLYFSIFPIATPNLSLYFDHWISKNFSTKDVELRFKEYIKNELKRYSKYKLNFIDIELREDEEDLSQNLLIFTTRNKVIIAYIYAFKFPLYTPDREVIFNEIIEQIDIFKKNIARINNTIFRDKHSKRSTENVFITNYNIFSGLIIKDIPIQDSRLFFNYFITGQISSNFITSNSDSIKIKNYSKLKYYYTESDFNENINSFLHQPGPIFSILARLGFKDLQITPQDPFPKIIVEQVVHLEEEAILEQNIGQFGFFLKEKYYTEDKNKLTDNLLTFTFAEILRRLANASYETLNERNKLFKEIFETKKLGIAHLIKHISTSLNILDGKPLIPDQEFEIIDYNEETVKNLLLRSNDKLTGAHRLFDLDIADNYTDEEAKQIISNLISDLGIISHFVFKDKNNQTDDIIEFFIFKLSLLYSFNKKFNIESYFYASCSNLIAALNEVKRYQQARDICEEILLTSTLSNKHHFGWQIMFECYTNQRIIFDSGVYGCLFIASIIPLPFVTKKMCFDILYSVLIFLRNFKYIELIKNIHNSLMKLDLDEYDRQKVTLSFYYSFINEHIRYRNYLLDAIKYLYGNIDKVISFGYMSVIPWLIFCYNLRSLGIKNQKNSTYDINHIISKLESELSQKLLNDVNSAVFPNKSDSKNLLIGYLTNLYQTRDVFDLIYEIKSLTQLANTVLEEAIALNDLTGILLGGIIINDQSFVYKGTQLQNGSIIKVTDYSSNDLNERFNCYSDTLLEDFNLKPNQVFIWLFNIGNKFFYLKINHNKIYSVINLPDWNFESIRQWIIDLPDFYFNSKKVNYYDLAEQERDNSRYLQHLKFTDLKIEDDFDEMLFCSSVSLSSFPFNLIQNYGEFVSRTKPVCNVISVENYVSSNRTEYIQKDYSASAWIPIDDNEATISWGYTLLEPILSSINCKVSTSLYPDSPLSSDINIFLAHGEKDITGFKAIFSNPDEHKIVFHINHLFGKGKIAILFICNSGGMDDDIFSTSIVSLAGDILKLGFKSVIASFWKYDVTMAPIWLNGFLTSFRAGFSVNESVFLANKVVSEYDESSGRLFFAPTGSLAMHLYGNPNIYLNQN
ncbi:hypothetical protein [Larkinella arboricola]